MNYSAPSVRALVESGLDMRNTSPEQIRAVWKAASLDSAMRHSNLVTCNHGMTRAESRLHILNLLIAGYGVEYLGQMKRSARHVWHVNMGDTYAATLVAVGRRLIVSDWGTLVESGTIRMYDRFSGELA